jgi:hypothetical protein
MGVVYDWLKIDVVDVVMVPVAVDVVVLVRRAVVHVPVPVDVLVQVVQNHEADPNHVVAIVANLSLLLRIHVPDHDQIVAIVQSLNRNLVLVH